MDQSPLTLAHPAFGALNYTVLAVYLIAMLIIGIRAGRNTRGVSGYFIAEGRAHSVLVGLSLLGTYLSPLTMMALPALSFGEADWTWTVQLPFLLVTAVIITGFVLPRYRQAGCISVYAFLERRIHVSARMLAAVAFLVLSLGRKGLVLYLPSLAFSTVTGADLATTIIALGVITTVYTVLGGIKGIILTDAIQVVILVAGGLATLFYVLTLGHDFAAVTAEHHKFRTFDWNVDIAKIGTMWLVLQTLFETVRIYATQQDMTQRYMAAASTREANRSVWLSILGYIPLGYLFYLIGTGLFAFYQVHPDAQVAALEPAKHFDAIYAHFVVTQMPAPLSGLVIAAFFAAAMSTISSSMNANSAVCIEDFYRRFQKRAYSEAHYLRLAKMLSVVWGGLSIITGLLFMEIVSAQIVWTKVMAVTTCGVVGLMALAFLPLRIRPWAAVAGFATAYAVLFVMMFFLQVTPEWKLVGHIPEDAAGIHYLLWPVIGNLVCFGVGLLGARRQGGH